MKTSNSPPKKNARMMIDVDRKKKKKEKGKQLLLKRGSCFQPDHKLGSEGARPALLVLITRKPVCRTHKHNRNTGDHIAALEPLLETNSGFKDFTDYSGCFSLMTASERPEAAMDFLNHNYLNARSPYDYTFNFWNDYLGLTTLVTKNNKLSIPQNPNSITESLKATLGLDDSPPCPCVISGSVGDGGHLDCCCPSGSPPPPSILDLKERFSILSPFQNQLGVQLPEREVGFGGSFAGFDLFGMERKMRKPASRSKQEPKICVFCRNNGAPEEVYGSHVLKTPDGRVVCPILRAYTCPLCSANGDNAHTIKYCPLSKDQPSQRPLKGGRAVGGKRMKIF